jgi:hypothetical protein
MTNNISFNNNLNLSFQTKTDNPPFEDDDRFLKIFQKAYQTTGEFDNPLPELFEDIEGIEAESIENNINPAKENPIPSEIPSEKEVSKKRKSNTEEQNSVKKMCPEKGSKFAKRKPKNIEKVSGLSNCKEPQDPPKYPDFKSHETCNFETIYNDKNLQSEQKIYLIILIIKDVIKRYGKTLKNECNLRMPSVNLLHPINRYFSFDENGTIFLDNNERTKNYSTIIDFQNIYTQHGNVVAIGKIIQYLFKDESDVNLKDFKEKNIHFFNLFQDPSKNVDKWLLLGELSSVHNALVDFNFKDVK